MIRAPKVRKESGSSQNWVYGEMVSRLTVNQLFRVRIPVDPRSPETTGNPHSQYGSRSVKPVKWGKIALVVEWLAHIPDKNENKVQFLARVQKP